LRCLEDPDKGFILVYEDGLYVFRGEMGTGFGNAPKINFSEIAIDEGGVLMDLGGRVSYSKNSFNYGSLSGNLVNYQEKFLSIGDDSLYSGSGKSEKLVIGNFDLVRGRKFRINSEKGIDFDLLVISQERHSGHLVMGNSLIMQYGFINSQRIMSGASDVLFNLTEIGSKLVDESEKRGSSGA